MSVAVEAVNEIRIVGRVHLFEGEMTSKEFAALPPGEAVKLELWEGCVTMAARPNLYHQHFLGQLYVAVSAWVKRHGLGMVFFDSLMELSEKDTPAPDLQFVASEHRTRAARKWVAGPADMCVEILSPNDRRADRVTKFQKYAEAGVGWYWIVDLDNRSLEEYELQGSAYGAARTVPFDEAFEPRLFAGLRLDLAAMELR